MFMNYSGKTGLDKLITMYKQTKTEDEKRALAHIMRVPKHATSVELLDYIVRLAETPASLYNTRSEENLKRILGLTPTDRFLLYGYECIIVNTYRIGADGVIYYTYTDEPTYDKITIDEAWSMLEDKALVILERGI